MLLADGAVAPCHTRYVAASLKASWENDHLIQSQEFERGARIQNGNASKLTKNQQVFVPANDQINRHGDGAG